MCTAITYQPRELYMGRSLDYEASYGEEIVMLPRRFPLRFRHGGGSEQGYAILGTAHVADGYPLYYDAVNEKGLGIAGLNFVGNAHYAAPQDGRQNVAQFEFIPWLLRQCATLAEARQLLQAVNLTGTPFSAHFPAAQLHWLLADTTGALTLEPTAAGLQIYENPVGVLTNNPPFPQQLFALNNYMHLSPRQPENTFAPDVPLQAYSRGMGALGLPGDLSSGSRFVRAAFTKLHSVCGESEADCVGQFFHIMRRSRRRAAAARSHQENLSARSTPRAGMPRAASITTRPTATAASQPSTCTASRWTARRCADTPC